MTLNNILKPLISCLYKLKRIIGFLSGKVKNIASLPTHTPFPPVSYFFSHHMHIFKVFDINLEQFPCFYFSE